MVVEEGNLTLDGECLIIPDFNPDEQGVWLNIYACLREPKLWAEKGYAVASEQFELAPYSKIVMQSKGKTPEVSQNDSCIKVFADSSEITVDSSGALVSWKTDGKELLAGSLEPYFWKPVNDNQDKNGYYKGKMSVWETEASKRSVKLISTCEEEGMTKIIVNMNLPIGVDYDLSYTLDSEGRIRIDADNSPFSDTIPLMPKFGMRMRLPKEMTEIEYLGRGPWENYPDRKRSAFIGRYSMPLAVFQHDYIRPQDNGNRCDVSYLILNPANGADLPSVKIEAIGDPLCIRAWDYSEDDLSKAKHPYELRRGEFVNVNIDHNVHGVGGTDTWGRPTLDKYTIKGTDRHNYSFILSANQNR